MFCIAVPIQCTTQWKHRYSVTFVQSFKPPQSCLRAGTKISLGVLSPLWHHKGRFSELCDWAHTLSETWNEQKKQRMDISYLQGVNWHAEDALYWWKTFVKWILQNIGPFNIERVICAALVKTQHSNTVNTKEQTQSRIFKHKKKNQNSEKGRKGILSCLASLTSSGSSCFAK